LSRATLAVKAQGSCGGDGLPACDDLTYCVLEQAGAACHDFEGQTAAGWCYVDPERNAADDPALVNGCASKRRLRFVDPANRTPEAGSQVLLLCDGAAVHD